MPELIDMKQAEQAVEAYLCSLCERNGNEVCYMCQHSDGAEIIRSVPTIDAESVRHGEWVETEPDEDDRKLGIEFSIKCSICHDENSHLDFNENSEIIGKTFWKSRFCPNCGAKMNNHIADVSKKVGDDNGK